MQLSQICRLCLEEKTNNETVLVEIFSAFVNEPGKAKLNDKIRSLTGLSILKNDGLPPKICHKCVVSIDSFYDFKNRVLTSDEKLRQFLNLNGSAHSDENHEESNAAADTDVIRLDPNKVYESSSEEETVEISFESNNMHIEQQQEQMAASQQQRQDKNAKKPCNASTRDKIEIFHCKYCDVVFSEMELCANHENFNHDKINPYECTLCPFKANQQQQLIIHIKNDHQTDKPFFCVVCSKSFSRRSDLRKHIFVHAGIRLFSCNLCSKSFTRAQNLAKHKRTHSEGNQKNHKCSLCPKAFVSNSELSRHMEIHMNRNTLNCKYCNQVFTQRDELDIHQRSHIVQIKAAQVQQMQATPIVFYNQNPSEAQQSPMNFYKEHVDVPQSHQQQQHQQPQPPPRIEHPIINQLLTNFNNSFYKCDKCLEQFPSPQLLQSHQIIHHSKNFACTICPNSYYKKKELDRHVISAHTDIKYNCSKCSKSFSRKDKLTRHERTHLVPSFFNCPLCPAVFVRKHLLDLHSKIHMMPNNNNVGPIDGSGAMMVINYDQQSLLPPLVPQPVIHEPPSAMLETPMPTHASPSKQPSPLDLSAIKVNDEPPPLTPAYPMNLTVNQSSSEPMDLSNEKTFDDALLVAKIEPTNIVLDSDEDDDLRIIENHIEQEKEKEEKEREEQELKLKLKHESTEGDSQLAASDFIPKTENEEMPASAAATAGDNGSGGDPIMKGSEPAVMNCSSSSDAEMVNDTHQNDDLATFQMSRLSDLDNELGAPTKDLPMEILQSPDV